MIGRNDPCTCGSGKKYKRCCGKQGTDLVELIVNEELDRILVSFFENYPEGTDRQEMMRLMREWNNRLSGSWNQVDVEEASSEFYLFAKNKRSWKTYITQQLEHVKRESVLEVLPDWDEPFMLLAEITGVEVGMLKVRELFSEQEYYVIRNEGMPTDNGILLFGAVLRDPRKGERAIAPVSAMIFLARWSKQTKKSLVELKERVADKTTEEFIVDHALDIYELFIKRSVATMNELVEDVLLPSQLGALKALDSALHELGQTTDSNEMMHKLAVAYFMNENTDVPVEGDFLAGAVITGMEIGVIRDVGLGGGEVRQKYGASEEGMRLFAEQLSSLYSAMMEGGDETVAAHQFDIGTDPRPAEKGLWETAMTTAGVVQPERKPDVAEGRAQLLAYEAFAAESEEQRRELAENAAEIMPDHPDVLLLHAEVESDTAKASSIYEKAIRNASRVFEPGDNPWMNIPNRPFMRAAFAYGIHLFSHGIYSEAADVFKDLVKMNSTDNQGARYEAVASLIHAERYAEAAETMVRYEKGSSHDATYLYLDWKLEYEASGGKSTSAEEMLETAAKANSHVMHLMKFKAKTIPYPKYSAIQPGSEDEARYIWWLLNGAR